MSALENAARHWARMERRVLDADAGELGARVVARDGAAHDLLLAAGERCECDAGTCPGPITGTWFPTLREVDQPVIDTGPL